jgi:hypothetical protein
LTVFGALMLAALAFANSGRAAIETPPPPSVWSDKADYAPGEQVNLSGANWAPGESVHIRVNDDAGVTWRRDVDVTADESGAISDQFNLPDWFVAQYSVTATGASSGTATWTFTDGNVSSATIGMRNAACTAAQPGTPPSYSGGSSACAHVVATIQGGGTTDWRIQWYAPGVSLTTGTPARDVGFTEPAGTNTSTRDDLFTVTTVGTWTLVVCKTSNAGSCSAGNQVQTQAFTVTAANTAPTASAQTVSTNEDTAKVVTLTGSDADGNALTFAIGTAPSHGSLGSIGAVTCTGTAPKNCSANVTYTPALNYNGSDSFTFKVNDGTVDSAAASVSITVNAVNDAPAADAQSVSTNEDTAKTITLTGSDVDGNNLTFAIGTGPSHGSLGTIGSVTCTGTAPKSCSADVTYTPALNYNGSDSFTFKVNDGTVDSAAASVSITVNAVDDDPTVTRDDASVTVNEGAAATNSGTYGDVDGDTVALSASIGTVTNNGDGTWDWSYVTSDGPDQSQTVTISGSDGSPPNAMVTFALTVNNVAPTADFSNDGPVNEGSSFTLHIDNGDDVSPVDKAAKFTFAFDCGDGAGYGAFTSTPTLSASTTCSTSDNGTRAVKAKIKDKDGGVREYTGSVTVANVAPTATFNSPASVNEGSDIHVSLTSPFDPSSADTSAGFEYRFDCGSGYGAWGSDASRICPTNDNGTRSVKGAIRDKDLDETEYTASVTVNNVAPKVNLTGADSVDEGDTETYHFTITDPGTADTFSFVSGYPTCGEHGQVVGTPLIGDGEFDCYFPDGNNYTDVAVKVKDDDGGVSVADTEHVEVISVFVANVAPDVTGAADDTASEGSAKSFSLGSFTDPGEDSPWAVEVDWGDGTTPHTTFDETSTGAASSQTIAAKTHTYDDNGNYQVDVTVTDRNGASDTASFHVVVANVAPTATFNSPASVNEGSDIHVSVTSPSDPSSADTTAGFTYAFDCGSGYGSFGAVNNTDCPTSDNGSRTVKGKIRDKDGGVSEYTASVTVNNVSPTVTAASNQGSDEGENHSFSLGSFSDQGSDSPWAVDVDWGDTSTHATFNETFAGPASSHTITAKSHKYDDNGSYTVTVKVTDKDGGYDSKTFSVSVANVAPSGNLGNNGPINESGSATVSFSSVSDPSTLDNATLHFAFDCNGGSLAGTTYATASPASSTSCSYNDGPSDHTVTGVIIDKDGGRHDASTTVHVNNVAPTATFSNNGPVNEGSSFTIQLTGPSDPSSADTSAGFQYAFDCGDGSGYGSFGTASSRSCPTSDNGSRSVKGKIRDKDNDTTEYTGSVTVNNVAPTATFSNDGPVSEGSSFHLSLTSPNDPSTADTTAGFTYAFDCGDGSGYGGYGGSSTATCATTDNGTRSVKAKIRDKDGGYTPYTASVTVNNVKPTITNVTATNTYAGPLAFMTSVISTFFTDPGADAPWVNLLTFSDGGTESGSGNASPIILNHKFTTPGCKTVTSRITDKDGAYDTFGPTPVNVGTGEFLPPITNTPVTNKLKNGQVLPVKVKLTDCNGAPVTGLNPAIALKKGDLTSVGDDSIVAITPGSVSNADTTGIMRSSGDGSYIYNMNVNITLNTDYTLIVYPFGLGSSTQYLAHVIQATK